MKKLFWTLPGMLLCVSLALGSTKGDPGAEDQNIIQTLSDRYLVSPADISLVRQKLRDWREVLKTLVIAQRSGQTPLHILSLKESMDWDRIMETYALSKADVDREIELVQKEIGQGVGNM